MRILLVHQNFPGQFKHLGPELVKRGHRVVATSMRRESPKSWAGIQIVRYQPARSSAKDLHPWVSDLETKVIRGEAFFRLALKLREQGFVPDLVIAHPGWGETLFIKDVWPDTKLAIYCEFFYKPHGADSNFDPEFPSTDPGDPARIRLKNLNNVLHFDLADAAISPTHWQASTFPEPFRSKIEVIHDGVDTSNLHPDPDATVTLQRDPAPGSAADAPRSVTLSRKDEVLTFVNRNLEPYRGFHSFMRMLPDLLAARPGLQVVVVGGDGVSYGSRPKGGGTWKATMLREMGDRVSAADWGRVHFTGKVPYPDFVRLLQVSTVHLYLTYPFVLSWSLIEAMSCACAIVASDTPPLREVIEDGVTGRMVDFFDTQAILRGIVSLLDDPDLRTHLGRNARSKALQDYDLHTRCLPAQLDWVESLLSKQRA
jgi:glycosyltransferase involved in cell wall biosynthesis